MLSRRVEALQAAAKKLRFGHNACFGSKKKKNQHRRSKYSKSEAVEVPPIAVEDEVTDIPSLVRRAQQHALATLNSAIAIAPGQLQQLSSLIHQSFPHHKRFSRDVLCSYVRHILILSIHVPRHVIKQDFKTNKN